MGKLDDGGEIDQQMVRALAHPLRVLILRMLEEGPSSPKQLAEHIGEPLANVSYHMRVLNKDCECIELIECVPRRGAVEHIYRLKPDKAPGSKNWLDVPDALRTHYAGAALAGFVTRAIEALNARTVESRVGSGITWLPLDVDEEGWGELVRVLGRVEEECRAVAARCAERMECPTGGVSVMVGVAAYEISGEKDVGTS